MRMCNNRAVYLQDTSLEVTPDIALGIFPPILSAQSRIFYVKFKIYNTNTLQASRESEHRITK